MTELGDGPLDAPGADHNSQREFIRGKLQELRRRLLDLTSRNPLLHYRHPVGSSVRIVDELPEQVVSGLLENGSFTLEPVPIPTEAQLRKAGYLTTDPATGEDLAPAQPTAEAWAKQLGIRASFELPQGTADGRHEDKKLQTLLFPHSLEARLRSIRARADSAEAEMGCHILFLVVGFLEWYESQDSDRPRVAPLYTLPVELTRDRLDTSEGAFRYRIALRDEDVIDNVTLREKLTDDFGLALPPIAGADGPEAYFEKVRTSILRQQPRWRLHRHITLATLNFQKQAMYADLDPDRWGDAASILDHHLIRMFFTSKDSPPENDRGPRTEYQIDEVPNVVDDYPVVFDADSSQHSAIIDVLRGGNLVIEGPPGTGKSQTIANLIAASIARGKSVLFVAEKMAALDVVHARLQKAGLGPFCLELHGHRAQKTAVVEALGARLAEHFRSPANIVTEKQLLQSHRDRLNQHAVRMNNAWGNTGKTPHQIFAGAARYAPLLSSTSEVPRIDGLSGHTLTPAREHELLDNLQRLVKLHAKVAHQTPGATLESHYWCGVRNLELLTSGYDRFIDNLRAWTRDLKQVEAVASQAASDADLEPPSSWTTVDLQRLHAAASALPPLTDRERLETIPKLAKHIDACRRALKSHAEIHEQWSGLLATLSERALADEASSESIDRNVHALRDFGITGDVSLRQLADCVASLARLQDDCGQIESAFGVMRDRVPDALHDAFRTSKHSLGELLTLADLIRELPRELWRHRNARFDNPDLDALLAELNPRLMRLQTLRRQLESTFELTKLPTAERLGQDLHRYSEGGPLRWLSKSWRRARRNIFALARADKFARRGAPALASRLLDYARELEGIDRVHLNNPALGDLYQGADTPVEQLCSMRRWYSAVRNEYGSAFSTRAPFAQGLFDVDGQLAHAIVDRDGGGFLRLVAAVIERLDSASAILSGHALARDGRATLAGDTGLLRTARSALESFLASVTPLFQEPSISLAKALQAASALNTHRQAVASWITQADALAATEAGFALSPLFGERLQAEVTALSDTLTVATLLAEHPSLLSAFSRQPNANRYAALKGLADILAVPLVSESTSRDMFRATGDVDIEAWSRLSGPYLPALIARNQNALDHEAWITDWLGYQRVRASLLPKGLAHVIRYVEDTGIDENQVVPTALGIVYRQLAEEVLQQDAELRDFYGPDQETIRERFQECDRSVLRLKRQEIASHVSYRRVPGGRSGGRVGEYTDRALVEHESQKKRRHIPLRDLLDRAGDAITALKPCFLMSPMSVATHLRSGRHRFDLVIMDEASQIKPEDALGAIARANTLVVVGDPKQLPPTSFFDRSVDGEGLGEDEVALEESESILDAVTSVFPVRRLRWHYRSRHESLIAYSAQSFYHNDLVLFPSPYERDPAYGIKVHRVDGFFQEVNAPESRAVVDFLIEQLANHPNESVGVVAMSANQCTLICEQLDARIKVDPRARALIEANLQADEPAFFKNLESVQGDERDVIVISMTYGPLAPGGAVPQRFGPINRSDGWRRLNVLFTRARKRMHVFTSMSASDIVCGQGTSNGRKALHGFLAYCEKTPESAAAETGRSPGSDFEVSVMAALQAKGYSCAAQLGVAGYFLDLAVRDPKNPNRYLLGIECDGATYHSAKSARDRDRLREEVLRGLGWDIVRIWSTDWFRNPAPQIQRVLNAIRSRVGAGESGVPPLT